MIRRSIPLPYALVLVHVLVLPVTAQNLIPQNTSIQSNLCVGAGCVETETYAEPVQESVIRIDNNRTRIEFVDASNPVTNFPTNDWSIFTNDFTEFGDSYFAVQDDETSNVPFRIDAGAPTSALHVANNGRIGLGTTLPQDALHATGNFGAALRLEQTGKVVVSPRVWSIAGRTDFSISDLTANSMPFRIDSGTPNATLHLNEDSRVGLGTNTPEGKLHTEGSGVQLIYFESDDGGAVQARFRTDSENRRFLAVNNANEVQTQMQFRDNAILFLGQTVADEWLRVDSTGITTAGPTCGSPCDLTFDPEHFTVPPIAERAALMWKQKHLPAIGPTEPHTPINLTEKTGGIIHELEVAHIYIEQLHSEIAQLKAEQQEMRTQFMARLETLEANWAPVD